MRRFIAIICFLVAGSSMAYAGGFSVYEASIRANGMLGAFAAYADHVTTIYYNPAGLAGLEGFNFAGGATIIAPRSSFRGPLPFSNTEYEMEDQNFFVPNIYGSYQIKKGLTAGAGIYAPFGLGTKWDEGWVGRGESIESEIQTLFVNPAIGYTLPGFGIGKVHVGAGLMVGVYGEVKLSRAVRSFTPEGTFGLEGSLKQPGIGFNVGILYEPVDMITLGFTYRSQVEMEFEGDAVFTDLPVGFPSTARGGATIDMPASWVAAVKVEPIPGLKAEVDYVWWGWSSYDELVIEFDQTIPALGGSTISSERNYEDTWQVRGGVEFSKLPFTGLTLRAGIAFDNNPIREQYVDPTLPDSDRWLFSGGITYSVTPLLDIDVSYIFVRTKERRIDHEDAVLRGVYNTYAHLPGIGITVNL